MIVVLKHRSTDETVRRVTRRVEELGLKAHVVVGQERTVIAAIGEWRDGEKEKSLSYDEVEKVMPIMAPYKVASREMKPERTVVRAARLVVGGGTVAVIAGPVLGRERGADPGRGPCK